MAAGSAAAVGYTQVVELEIVGIVAFCVLLVVAGVGRGRDDIVPPGAVGGSAVEGVLAVLGYIAVASELEGEAGALVSVIVLESEKIAFAVVYPVGGGLGLPAVALRGDASFVQGFGRYKVGGGLVLAAGLCYYDVAAYDFGPGLRSGIGVRGGGLFACCCQQEACGDG